VIAQANRYVQTLNDAFTDPSGELVASTQPAPVATAPVVQTGDVDPSREEPQQLSRP
jgi:hypothetical protein